VPKALQRLLVYLLIGGTIVTAFLSSTSYLGLRTQVIDLASNFKVQYLVISFLIFILFLCTRKKAWKVISLVILLINLLEVIPWYLPALSLSQPGNANLRVFQLNIAPNNPQFEQILSLVRKENPDIAVFLEADKQWIPRLRSLEDILPYRFEANYRGSAPEGIKQAIYSKLPLENAARKLFADDRTSLVADINYQGQVISIIATHPIVPIRRKLFYLRNLQLQQLSKYAREIKNPVILSGDLNTTMWSPYYKQFERISRLHNTRKGFGILPSWPYGDQYSRYIGLVMPLVKIPIDHCMISSQIRTVNTRVGPSVGSDHLPLISDLAIPGKNG
jgi:endonuclease/exonuclease/phosphatase (EEP) superfamily protein YafD